jgi:diaminopimelate decarboxylase
VSYTALAEEFGTPLFVYDSAVLARQFAAVREILPPGMDVFYSLKANPNVSVCAALRGCGAGAEVSSLAELETARLAGVAARDIIFLGPGKSRAELASCLEQGVHAIVCESVDELVVLDEMARDRGVVADVALRINPAFSAKGSRLTMGGRPRQFGVDEDFLLAQPDLTARFPSLRFMGVHVYLGTRILDEQVIVENTVRILDLAERVARGLGVDLELVDVGGGWGIAYFDGERDLDLALLGERLTAVLADFQQRHPGTRLVTELGRFLVALAGTYVVRVRYV